MILSVPIFAKILHDPHHDLQISDSESYSTGTVSVLNLDKNLHKQLYYDFYIADFHET